MKQYQIEIVIDEEGGLTAETSGMQGETCVGELDAVLSGIEGEREVQNTGDYNRKPAARQVVRARG